MDKFWKYFGWSNKSRFEGPWEAVNGLLPPGPSPSPRDLCPRSHEKFLAGLRAAPTTMSVAVLQTQHHP